jgi:hypothetical protein
MKIYRLTWLSPAEGTQLSWHHSKAAANKALKEIPVFYVRGDEVLLDEDEDDGDEVYEFDVCAEVSKVDFPSRKSDLIRWLNAHFNTDNG